MKRPSRQQPRAGHSAGRTRARSTAPRAAVSRVALTCALALCAAGVLPTAASASTVGQLFTPTIACGTSGTFLQTAVPSGTSYTAPGTGTITSWSFETGAEVVPELELKVAEHVAGNEYKIVASSKAGAETANAVNTYSTSIAVKEGDVIGIYEAGGDCIASVMGAAYAWVASTNEPLGSTATYEALTGDEAPVSVEVAEPPGAISGRVTNASNGTGLGGIELCAFPLSIGSEPSGQLACAKTGLSGEYTVSGLEPGSYELAFFPAETCEEELGTKVRCVPSANFVDQSREVLVKSGKTAEGVNVALQAGGEITGTVTGASITHPPLARVEVVASAVNAKGEETGAGGRAYTNASGAYTVTGLPTGSYKLEFDGFICTVVKTGPPECPEEYVTQYYHGQQTFRAASPVAVTLGSLTAGIDESLREAFPTTPASTGAPTLTGTAAVGARLTCSQGSWSHEPTALAYQWLRDGATIAGQNAATYTLQSADAGHSIACVVWAGNGAGIASAESNAIALAAPRAPLAKAGGTAAVKGASALLKLTCAGTGPCSGTLSLTARVKHGKRRRTVVLGRAHFSIAAGKSLTLHLHLSAKGRALVHKAGRRGLTVKLTGSSIATRTLVLKAKGSTKSHGKRRSTT